MSDPLWRGRHERLDAGLGGPEAVPLRVAALAALGADAMAGGMLPFSLHLRPRGGSQSEPQGLRGAELLRGPTSSARLHNRDAEPTVLYRHQQHVLRP
ncbi:hypothetical protein [Streptomyces sp. NPDC001604]|uniref:hypothetical protein n=1 Tax=Streptomyces sp. NPDC001604 TaxID=3364593 RepID=UPI0036819C97